MIPIKHAFSYWLYCKFAMLYFLEPLSKINLPSPLWNQNFLTCHNRFFTKILLPHFGRWDVNVMTLPNQLAPKEITNLQNTTAWLQNSAKLYKKIYLNDFRLGILGNTKVREKSEIGWRQMLVPSLPFRNNFLVIAVKNYTWKM